MGCWPRPSIFRFAHLYATGNCGRQRRLHSIPIEAPSHIEAFMWSRHTGSTGPIRHSARVNDIAKFCSHSISTLQLIVEKESNNDVSTLELSAEFNLSGCLVNGLAIKVCARNLGIVVCCSTYFRRTFGAMPFGSKTESKTQGCDSLPVVGFDKQLLLVERLEQISNSPDMASDG
jgi:hypothetical protein